MTTNRSKENVVRASIEKTRVYRLQSNRLADFCHRNKIGYSDDDLYAVVMYCSGPQLCMHFDALTEWSMMIVNALPKNDKGDTIIPSEAKYMATKDMRDTAQRYARRELGHTKAEVLDHVYDPLVVNTMLVLIRTKGGVGKDTRLTLVVKDYEVISECDAADFYRNAPWWKRIDRVWTNTKTESVSVLCRANTCVTCGATTLRLPLPDGKTYCPSCRDAYPSHLRSRHETV